MNLPTKLTILRILLIPLFIAFFFIDMPYFRFAATGVFIIASFTDFLDGYLARKHNLITDLGKFLDPIADKMLVACALIAVIFNDTADIFRILTAVATMIILCRELAVSGFRIVASAKNVKLAADKLGKIKTNLQMICLIILLPIKDLAALSNTVADIYQYTGLIILGLATIMTLVSGINYIAKNRQVLKD